MPDDAGLDLGGGPVRAPVLGIGRSISGKCWRLRPTDDRLVAAMAQRFAMPEPLARVLSARGVDLDGVDGFLRPTLRRLLPDPDTLKDMRRGAERLARAVVEGERVVVFADYDVDGATASAVLRRYLRAAGLAVGVYVPDRLSEGYGPSREAFARLRAEGTALVVTVDCGIGAHAALAAAREDGLDVVVVDHHRAQPTLPPAVAVINPNRLDEDGTCGHLAAVGVAFLLAVAVNRILRELGWFEHRDEPDLLQLLDLVALGTVCDMVPLAGLNRAFVVQGLKVMAGRRNPGLRALADVAGLTAAPSPYDLGFALGPRINAGGRVGRADFGARLLATDDAAEATTLARALDGFNRDRQKIEQAVLDDALNGLASAAAGDGVDRGEGLVVWTSGRDWHPGVVGIVAGRLAERLGRPAFVMSTDEATAVGSARSVPGFDLGAAINAAVQTGLLLKGGGHAMAAGFSVAADRAGDFRAFVEERFARFRAGNDEAPPLHLDGLITAAGASSALIEALTGAGPFGVGNPEPRFVLAGVRVVGAAVMAERHVRCTLADGTGAKLAATAFRAVTTALGEAILGNGGRSLHVAGRLSRRIAGGPIRLVIDDAAVPA
jgi:single-stranded-DNA-specific exonuclease